MSTARNSQDMHSCFSSERLGPFVAPWPFSLRKMHGVTFPRWRHPSRHTPTEVDKIEARANISAYLPPPSEPTLPFHWDASLHTLPTCTWTAVQRSYLNNGMEQVYVEGISWRFNQADTERILRARVSPGFWALKVSRIAFW